MDRIAAVLASQWRAYWRRVQRAGNISTNNAGLLIVLGGVGVFKYLQQLPVIARQLAHGETSRYETVLLLVFLAWLLPAMGESRRSISSRALLLFPFSSRELFLIRLGSVFISPVTWIIAAGSLALGFPVATAAYPATGMAALVLFLLFALAMGLTFAHLLASAYMRRLSLLALLGLSAVVAASWFAQASVLPANFAWWPNRLVADAAVASPLGSLAVLLVMTVGAFCLSLWTFTRSLQPGQTRRSQRFTVLGLIDFPGRLGGLLKKDVRYFSRLLDVYIALPIVILFSSYLASAPDPSVTAFIAVLALLFLPGCSLAFNCLGFDGSSGFDRYTLLPLSGRDILLSKNLAFGMLTIVLCGVIFPLAFWRLGARSGALGFIELILVGLAYLSWGNWMSVKQPYKLQFYRFSSGGSPADAVMGVLFGSLPGGITVYLLHRENSGALWLTLLLLLPYLALYYFSLTWAGRRLEQQREALRRAIS